jgi:FkbM family methyltransferase
MFRAPRILHRTKTPHYLVKIIGVVRTLIDLKQFEEALDLLMESTPESSHSSASAVLKAICLRNLNRPLEAIFWARYALTLDLSCMDALSLLSKLVSEPETRWVRIFIENPIDLVLDVGANTGTFAKDLRAIGYGGTIHSFEPVPDVYQELAKNASGDPNWHVYPVGLGSREGRLTIDISANNGESSSFLKMDSRHIEVAPHSQIIKSAEVDILTVDGFLKNSGLTGKCSLLKIDTQGYESEVLAGATDSLRNFDFLHLEMSLVPLYINQALIHDVLAFCYRFGFTAIDLHPYMFDGRNGHLLQMNGVLENSQKRRPQIKDTHAARPASEPQGTSHEKLTLHFAAAIQALNESNESEAERIGLRILNEAPFYFPVYNFMGEVMERMGRLSQAVAYYDQSIQMNPGHAVAFTRRALVLLRSHLGMPKGPRILESGQSWVAMPDLGKLGRFGNQIIQYAILRLYSDKAKATSVCPDWIGRDLYDFDDPLTAPDAPSEILEEECVLSEYESSSTRTNIGLRGFFSGSFIRWRCHREKIVSLFRPSERISVRVRDWINQIRKPEGVLVAIHLRRGDFDGSNFWICPESIYLNWLKTIWPTLDKPTLYIATDEEALVEAFAEFSPLSAKNIQSKLPGAEFYTDHAILSHADIVCVSPSTFSWTACWLNQTAKLFFRADRQEVKIAPWDPWACYPWADT